MNLYQLRFPIGEYNPNKNPNQDLLDQWINEIESFPSKLKNTVKDTSIEQLNWKYRPNGWKVKEVIHHCVDSHMNSIIRFKLALTEDQPTIRPYFEDRWTTLTDAQIDDVSDSLLLLEILHKKWGILLRSLSPKQLQRKYIHPEHGQVFNLAETIGNYAWHGNHHLAHVQNGLASKGLYNQ